MSLSGLLLPAHHQLGTGTVSLRCSEGPWAGNHLCPRSHVILPGPPIVTGSLASRHLGDPWTCLGLSWGCRCRKPRTGLQATVTCLGQGLMGGAGKAWMSSPCSAPGPLTGKVQEISLEACRWACRQKPVTPNTTINSAPGPRVSERQGEWA